MTHDAPPVELLPLGTAPRPTTGPELAERVRHALLEAAGNEVAGLDRARITAALDGPDVVSLDVDLTGVDVTLAGEHGDDEHEPWVPDGPTTAEDAVLRTLRVDAHPLTVESVPVDVSAVAEGLRFAWVETPDGRLGILPAEPSDDAPVTGHLRVAAPTQALVAAARRLVTDELATLGLTLTALDVELESRGPRSVVARGSARVRKGLLSASIRAGATAEVDARMVLTVRDLSLSSRNPVVAALLLVARKEIEKVEGHSVDLVADLPDGVRLADVHVETGEMLAVSARFA